MPTKTIKGVFKEYCNRYIQHATTLPSPSLLDRSIVHLSIFIEAVLKGWIPEETERDTGPILHTNEKETFHVTVTNEEGRRNEVLFDDNIHTIYTQGKYRNRLFCLSYYAI